MCNISKIFTVGMSIFSLLIVGTVAYINDKSIAAIRSEMNVLRAQSFSKTDNLMNSRDPVNVQSSTATTSELNQEIQQKESLQVLIPRISDFWGEIKEVKGQMLIVETRIADISKIDQFDESKKEASFPTVIKRFSVLTDQETIFTSKKLSELKAGDYVSIFSKKPIYGVDAFIATHVSYLTPEDLSMFR